jgi:hypothetical protein
MPIDAIQGICYNIGCQVPRDRTVEAGRFHIFL